MNRKLSRGVTSVLLAAAIGMLPGVAGAMPQQQNPAPSGPQTAVPGRDFASNYRGIGYVVSQASDAVRVRLDRGGFRETADARQVQVVDERGQVLDQYPADLLTAAAPMMLRLSVDSPRVLTITPVAADGRGYRAAQGDPVQAYHRLRSRLLNAYRAALPSAQGGAVAGGILGGILGSVGGPTGAVGGAVDGVALGYVAGLVVARPDIQSAWNDYYGFVMGMPSLGSGSPWWPPGDHDFGVMQRFITEYRNAQPAGQAGAAIGGVLMGVLSLPFVWSMLWNIPAGIGVGYAIGLGTQPAFMHAWNDYYGNLMYGPA